MNFPDVPFDETLFESNVMMKNYWERQTENRSYFAQDERVEEEHIGQDIVELRELSMGSFAVPETESVAETAEIVQSSFGLTEKPSIVLPKANSQETNAIILVVVIAVIVVVAHLYSHRSYKRGKSPRV